MQWFPPGRVSRVNLGQPVTELVIRWLVTITSKSSYKQNCTVNTSKWSTKCQSKSPLYLCCHFKFEYKYEMIHIAKYETIFLLVLVYTCICICLLEMKYLTQPLSRQYFLFHGNQSYEGKWKSFEKRVCLTKDLSLFEKV